MSDDLLVSDDAGVLTLTLNRPERKNALTMEIVDGIIAAVEGADAGDDTRVIVLRATGDDFCSGFDLGGSTRDGERPRTGHMQRSFRHGVHHMIRALDEAQLPVVAGVRGWAAGIGNTLALSADVVVASSTANFWVPFVAKGFTPDSGSTYLLPRLIGLARAKEMLLRAKAIDGEKAAAWGLVSECVADADLDDALDAIVAELAASATLAWGLTKTLVHRNLEVGLTAALQNEGIYEELAIRSDDFKEGLRAFKDRRPPEYRGR